MSEYTVSIPDDLYEKARRLAQATSQQVDDLIRHRLAGALDEPLFDLPPDEYAELKAMAFLSDDTLWTIAREQLPPPLRERIAILLEKNKQGTIIASEHTELSELVERGDKLTLRKAQALKYLTERGYKVQPNSLTPDDE